MIVPVRTECPLREAAADAELVLKISRLVLKIEAAAAAVAELVLKTSVFALRLDEWEKADIVRLCRVLVFVKTLAEGSGLVTKLEGSVSVLRPAEGTRWSVRWPLA